jgi:LmbE family N-acetylglucosaminyl deacetylase
MEDKKILIVAAHPDDEILGCGGTIARLSQEGSSICAVILGEGITSREADSNKKQQKDAIEHLRSQTQKAATLIGIEDVVFFDYPDNRFDTVPLLDIIKSIERVKSRIAPDILFTHYHNDLNIDHRITCNAVLTATRPVKDETVKTIYSFYTPSSTEWNYPASFNPNVFFDIETTISKKEEALKLYEDELREMPHPRSIKGIRINAQYWAIKTGFVYAEPFELVRSLQ